MVIHGIMKSGKNPLLLAWRKRFVQKTNIHGYIILSLCAILLITVLTINIFTNSIFLFSIFLLFLLFVLVSIICVFIKNKNTFKQNKIISKDTIMDILFVFLSANLTYFLVCYFKISSLVVSPAVGFFGAFIFRRRQASIFCGSFVGMTNPALLEFFPIILAGLLASFIYIFSREVFNGFGGKLGTVAFTGSLIIALLMGHSITNNVAFTKGESLYILLISVLASTLTYILNVRLKLGPVLSSSIIGLLGALLLLNKNVNFCVTLGTAIYGASFVGMTSKKVFANEGLIALAGMVFGLIFCYSPTQFCGVGGKLGATAFVSVLCIYGITHVIKKLFWLIKRV